MENKVLVEDVKYWCFTCQKECKALKDLKTEEVECSVCKSSFIELIEDDEQEDPRKFIPATVKKQNLSNSNTNTNITNTNTNIINTGNTNNSNTTNGNTSHPRNMIIINSSTYTNVTINNRNAHATTTTFNNMNGTNNNNNPNNLQPNDILSNILNGVFTNLNVNRGNQGNIGNIGFPFNFVNNFNLLNQEENPVEFENLLNTLFNMDPNKMGTPPTAKKVLDELPRIKITEENINLYKDLECSVCKENLAIGDVVIDLPCKHKDHQDCILPWLTKHNNCPVCRYELLTDDVDYENRKKDKEKK